MPRRTSISSMFIICAGATPSPRRGGGWSEGARRSALFRAVSRVRKLLTDCFENGVRVGEHVTVPEAKDSVAIFLDKGGSLGIAIGSTG